MAADDADTAPIGLGRGNPFPLTLGGGQSQTEQILATLLDLYAPAWDREEFSQPWAEAYADALAIAMIWAVNARAANQMFPLRMQENLPVYEELLSITAKRGEHAVERRRTVLASLRATAKNALIDIEAVATAIFTSNFNQLRLVPEADWVTYWKGLNPGPPGFEHTSNRAVVTIVVTKNGINDFSYQRKREKLGDKLLGFLPGWMQYEIGIDAAGGQFICNEGIVGQTLL